MKTTIKAAQESLPALGMMAQTALPAVASYKVSMILRKLKEPLAVFDEKRIALLKECGTPKALGPGVKEGEYDITDQARWDAEFGALQATEVELPVSPVKVAELGSAMIEPRVLAALEWCIVLE